MKVSFTAHDYSKDRLNIDLIISFKGKRFKRLTGVSVPKEYWLRQMQRCSEKINYPDGKAANQLFNKLTEAGTNTVRYFISKSQNPSSLQFWTRFELELTGMSEDSELFMDFFEADLDARKPYLSKNTIKATITVINIVRRYEAHLKEPIRFSDIDILFLEKFRDWFFSLTHGKKDKPYSDNYLAKVLSTIITVFNKAREKGLHKFPEITESPLTEKEADTVYLTPEELTRIYAVKLKHEGEKLARAKFLLGCYTGLRYSDYNKVGSLNVSDKFITLITEKVKNKVVIPINSTVREIISSHDVFKPITDQYLNRVIKEIAEKAEITQTVEILKYQKGRPIIEHHRKCDLISTHTARRSFATNTYKAGVPAISIMKITGHKTEKSFLKYIKISQEENANMLLQHSFFQ